MSPFSQLGRQINSHYGYGGGIDRDFSPVLNYLDEFDRHFSRRHSFMNCYIPRFDLEEDAHFYYLYGDVPGARVEDINIEVNDDHTLVIEGTTHRVGPPLPAYGGQQQGQGQEQRAGEGDGEFVKVNVGDHKEGTGSGTGSEQAIASTPPEKSEQAQLPGTTQQQQQQYPPPPQQQQPLSGPHPHHARHRTSFGAPTQSSQPPYAQNQQPPYPQQSPYGQQQQQQQPQQPPKDTDRRPLLSERLTGPFHRTFAFPTPVIEEGVQAVVENGVLFLTVPKREKGEKKRGRRVEVRRGGEDREERDGERK